MKFIVNRLRIQDRSNNLSPVIRVFITWLPYVFLYIEPVLNHMESNFAHFITKNSTLNNNKFNYFCKEFNIVAQLKKVMLFYLSELKIC